MGKIGTYIVKKNLLIQTVNFLNCTEKRQKLLLQNVETKILFVKTDTATLFALAILFAPTVVLDCASSKNTITAIFEFLML
jgi:hypothetical protein